MVSSRARRLAKQRKRELQLAMELKAKEDAAEVDRWLVKYDDNGDRVLQRDELRALLLELEPGTEPTEMSIDYIWNHAQTMRREHGTEDPETPSGGEGIPKWKIRTVVSRYREYLMRSQFLDEVFDRFDFDRSGKLEAFSPPEIKGFLRAVVEGTIVVRGDAGAERTVARTFKLRKLCEAKEKGILSTRSFETKWGRLTGGNPKTDIIDVEVTDGDVDFIIEHCDKNKDGAIGRNEIFATISVWMGLLIDQKRRRDAQEMQDKVKHVANPVAQACVTTFDDPRDADRAPAHVNHASGACSIM